MEIISFYQAGDALRVCAGSVEALQQTQWPLYLLAR